jgi:excisionase family DNA binding protein
MHGPVLRPKQAMAVLGVSNTKLYQMLRSGEIKSFKSVGVRFIPLASIEEWIRRNTPPENQQADADSDARSDSTNEAPA